MITNIQASNNRNVSTKKANNFKQLKNLIHIQNITRLAIFIVIMTLIVTSFSACGSSFSIKGKWKNIGDSTFGQVQKNSILIIDDYYCNLYSPKDTYAFYEENGQYKFDATSFLFGDTMSFDVNIIDNNNIELSKGNTVLSLTRVN